MGLHDHHAGPVRANPAHLLHLVEGFAHSDQSDAASCGIENNVGKFSSELLPELVSHGFLALDAVRLLERGYVVPPFAVLVLGDVFAAIGDQAVQLNDLGAKRPALHYVGCRGVRGHHDDRREPGRRGVGCQRTSRVAGRGSGQYLGAELLGTRDSCGHPAGFKGACRIQSLVFDVQALQAHGGSQAPHMDQGGHAFAERNRSIVGQDFSVPPQGT